MNRKRQQFDIEQEPQPIAASLEEQFARELEERKSTARNGYRSSFATYFVFMLLMAVVTDYLRINLLDGMFLGIMAASGILYSVQFGMLFAASYYFKEGEQAIFMEPIECVTEFLPFSKEVYRDYVKGKLLSWCRRIFFGSFIIHFIGMNIFMRDNTFPHFIWEYPMDWGRYVLDIIVILLFSGLISYLPLLCLKQMNKRRLYQGENKSSNKKVKKTKSNQLLSGIIAFGVCLLSYILVYIIHFLIYFEGLEAEKPMLLYAPYGQAVVILLVCGTVGTAVEAYMKEEWGRYWKKWLLIFLLFIGLVLIADSNGIMFYENSFVVRQLLRETEYSFDDVREYELHIEKRLGIQKKTVLLLSMKNRRQVKMNLSRNEMNDAAYDAYEPTGEWGFVLHYVKQLKEAGVEGTVNDRALIEKEIDSIYGENDEVSGKKEVKQCLKQICMLSEG